MRYGSVCSGIEAATVAWHGMGWQPAWFSEIEPFPSAVLASRYPWVANLGDMTEIADGIRAGDVEAPDVFVGGTPCQAFSLAGLRKGLADERGQLTLSFVKIADEIDASRIDAGKPPVVIVWENVQGVLSDKSNAFGCLLAGLAGEGSELQPTGRRWPNAGCVFGPKRAVAWRVLDAQYFGVAQRRKRVILVAGAGPGFDPAAILFEFEGPRRDHAPSRPLREGIAAGTPQGVDLRNGAITGDITHTIQAGHNAPDPGGTPHILDAETIRRATPGECERLQGFEAGYSLIQYRGKPATDQPRYKAVGNSMAVPVMRWVGWRIQHALATPANDNIPPAEIQAVA